MKTRWVVVLLALVIIGPAWSDETPAPPQRPAPCTSAEHRQFDFWIGAWDVHTADGKLAGTNVIRALFGGCVLEENWEGAGGSAGKSFNLYRVADGKWHQTWVDAQGGMLQLAGGLEDGKMVLSGSTPSSRGEMLDKITWEPLDDGRVRQHWQRSPDLGKTWEDVFDGFYSRQETE